MRYLIIGASKENDYRYIKDVVRQNDFIIGADGGLEKLKNLGIKPDLLVGDFDSFEGMIPNDVDVVKLPTDKDETDTFYAVKEGIKRGFKDFVIMGGLSGRLDHTIANLSVLEYLADHKYDNLILDMKNSAFVMNCGERAIYSRHGFNVSIFPIGCSYCKISLKGFLYNLDRENLYSNIMNGIMGVSNSTVSEKAQITVHEGKALIILSKD